MKNSYYKFKWLVILLLPFILGINKCELSPAFKEAVEQEILASKNHSAKLKLAVLPLNDKILSNKSQRVVVQLNSLLENGANVVAAAFNKGNVKFSFYDKKGVKDFESFPKLSAETHTIDTNKLLKLINNSSSDTNKLVDTVIDDYMSKLDNTDILLMGQYQLSSSKQLELEVFLFLKANKSFLKKTINLSNQKILCQKKGGIEEEICNNVGNNIIEETIGLFTNPKARSRNRRCGKTIADPDDILSQLPGECIPVASTSSSLVTFDEQAFKKFIKNPSSKTNIPSVSNSGGTAMPTTIPKNPPSTASTTSSASNKQTNNLGTTPSSKTANKTPKVSKHSPIYISNISFIEASAYTAIPKRENGWINMAVKDALKSIASKNKNIKFNETGHSINDPDSNLLNFMNAFYDPSKKNEERLSNVIKEILSPNDIDMLLTGEYEVKGKEVLLEIILIIEDGKKKVTEKIVLSKSEFSCVYIVDPISNDKAKGLCDGAKEAIEKSIEKLLDNL